MRRETSRWVEKAEDDFHGAHLLANKSAELHDLTCFHCQQCAEKYLKSLLVELRIDPPRTHNLQELMGHLRPHHPSLKVPRRSLAMLTRFAVTTRYPIHNASKRQAVATLRLATQIRAECRRLLGIR